MMISWLINTSTFLFLVISFSDYGTFPTCIYFIFELSPFHRLKACQNKKKGKYNKIETKQSKSQKYDKASYNAKGGGHVSISHTRIDNVYLLLQLRNSAPHTEHYFPACLLQLTVQVNSIFLSWLHQHIFVYKLDRHKINLFSKL